MRTPSLYSQDDPISAALKPPPTETDAERTARLLAEAEAKRISEQIDEELRLEREKLKKNKGDVKLLLLGQAESGKSTLQKQFQLMYKPNSLDMERASWKAVIYFNVVRSLKHILATLEAWGDTLEEFGVPSNGPESLEDSVSHSPLRPRINGISEQPSPSSSLMHPTDGANGISDSPNTRPSTAASHHPTASLDSNAILIANLRRRLSPLVAADAQLVDRLSGGIAVSGSGKGSVYVRSGWQSRTLETAMGKFKSSKRQISEDEKRSRESLTQEAAAPQDPLIQEVGRMLELSRNDIKELWEHPTVRGLIAKRKLKLDEWSEFFLRHISRVAASDYVPSTDDILHARIQTMGVAEHVFDVNLHGKSVTWHLYDVGGARGQRHSWVPYFDDAHAIIFVAPVSAFDQYLEEDPRTNRIDDSLQLFTQICSNALLKNVHLVLFLNKTDLLKAKLDTGLRVRKYITSFGERSNDYETVVQYFRAHFLQVHRKNNENRRVLYTHFTSVVDTKTTQRIIGNVRDSIFRGYLQSAALV
ncbi:guanine nucleotide-binding protein [Pluteus cervinus]|uniref:Guanine nucleotide-binding protein n=1 Tax=Pluteus cervinus TaxID=181527 RepID=A0ACD3AWZ7_9AGAR|nr:guanine nucleotide-binding protein [Pluteus cervinus]